MAPPAPREANRAVVCPVRGWQAFAWQLLSGRGALSNWGLGGLGGKLPVRGSVEVAIEWEEGGCAAQGWVGGAWSQQLQLALGKVSGGR